MTRAPWLIRGRHSKTPIVLAPGAPSDTADAVERLDAALVGFPGPLPRWFSFLQGRAGLWLYPAWIAVAIAAMYAVLPSDLVLVLLTGCTVGLLFAVLTGQVAYAAAKAQARARAGERRRSPEETIAALAHLARPAPLIGEQAELILAWDASKESEVHLLVWRAAEDTADGDAAGEALHELWAASDPKGASEFDKRLAEFESEPSTPDDTQR